MALGARGEGVLQVAEREFRVLFTNRALAEAEQATGLSVMKLADKDNLSIAVLARMLQVGLEAARRDMAPAQRQHKPYTLDDAWKIMDELGFAQVLPVVMEAFIAVITFYPSAAKAAEESPPQ